MTDTTSPPAARADDEPPRKVGRGSSAVKSVIEWAVVLGGALIVAFLIKTFLFQAFWIPSGSMNPTLVRDDRVLVNKLSYRLHDVNRGDVVVFERPPGLVDEQNEDLIKRVVGLPGETVSLEDGTVFVDGNRLDEPYLPDGTTTEEICAFPGRITVPEGEVFVMGDNRANSQDSRCFGPIDEDLIVGRAFVQVWPLGDFEGL